MRIALSVLFLSTVLFLPCISKAAEPTPATITTATNEPAPGALDRVFGWFRQLGNLKLDVEAVEDASRRYQDGQYVFYNGGVKGYHFMADISPDFKPGFYVHMGDPGTVAADLSLSDPSTGTLAAAAKKEGNVSFFMGPDLAPAFKDGRGMRQGDDARTIDGPDEGPDVGVRCGVRLKFN